MAARPVEEVPGHRTTEALGAISGELVAQDDQAVRRGEHAVQADGCPVGLDARPHRLGVSADRQRAPTPELGQEGPLGRHQTTYSGIVDGGQRQPGDVVVLAALHGQRPLPHLRQHRPGVEHLELEPGWWGPAQAVECGLGHHHCGHCARADNGQPGGQIPAQSGEGEVGTEVGQLDPPPGRAGGHRGPDGQGVETATDQHVAGVGPLGERSQHQSGHAELSGGGKVLGRMDGGVGLAGDDRGLHLLDEHTLASEPVEGDIEPPVAGGFDHHQGGAHPRPVEELLHPVRLPQGQR